MKNPSTFSISALTNADRVRLFKLLGGFFDAAKEQNKNLTVNFINTKTFYKVVVMVKDGTLQLDKDSVLSSLFYTPRTEADKITVSLAKNMDYMLTVEVSTGFQNKDRTLTSVQRNSSNAKSAVGDALSNPSAHEVMKATTFLLKIR